MQLAVKPTGVAVEFVVETSTPERRMCGATIRALGLDASGGVVAVRA
jgi:hypothetical protein